jgi:MFS family permease
MTSAKTQKEIAERNIKLYPLIKVFNKRVFLGVVPIYYVNYVGFSIQEVGLLAAIYALVAILANVPTGYIADRRGKTFVIRLAAILQICATLLYVLAPTKLGVVAGSILESLAFSFIGGAAEALVHDSLEVTGETSRYSKVLSRGQSIALLLNALFVGVVPLTYVIDPRLPFLCGTVAFTMLLVGGLGMRNIMVAGAVLLEKKRFHLRMLTALGRYKALIAFGFMFGIVGAFYFSFDVMTLALKQYGMPAQYIGIVFAAASLVGAALGLVIHHLKRLSMTQYMLLDMCILVLPFLAGYTKTLWPLIGAIILTVSFWRYRNIMYQDYMLRTYSTKLKTTLLSTMSTTESVHSLWVPIFVTGMVSLYGMSTGLGVALIACIFVAVVYVGLGRRITRS